MSHPVRSPLPTWLAEPVKIAESCKTNAFGGIARELLYQDLCKDVYTPVIRDLNLWAVDDVHAAATLAAFEKQDGWVIQDLQKSLADAEENDYWFELWRFVLVRPNHEPLRVDICISQDFTVRDFDLNCLVLDRGTIKCQVSQHVTDCVTLRSIKKAIRHRTMTPLCTLTVRLRNDRDAIFATSRAQKFEERNWKVVDNDGWIARRRAEQLAKWHEDNYPCKYCKAGVSKKYCKSVSTESNKRSRYVFLDEFLCCRCETAVCRKCCKLSETWFNERRMWCFECNDISTGFPRGLPPSHYLSSEDDEEERTVKRQKADIARIEEARLVDISGLDKISVLLKLWSSAHFRRLDNQPVPTREDAAHTLSQGSLVGIFHGVTIEANLSSGKINLFSYDKNSDRFYGWGRIVIEKLRRLNF